MTEFEPAAVASAATTPTERVGLGLLAALGAVVVGVVLTVVIWRAGYVASITSLAIAAGAIFVYAKAAGSAPRKGLVPLVILILAGVVASFFAVVASDLLEAYNTLLAQTTGVDRDLAPAKSDFIRDNIFNGALLKSYGKDMGMFALFAVLGILGTLRRLFASQH